MRSQTQFICIETDVTFTFAVFINQPDEAAEVFPAAGDTSKAL